MKNYTEAERAALIDHAKSWIADADGMRDEIPFGFDDDTEKELSLIKIALAALEANPVVVPEGWKLVPIKPTDEMCKAAYEARDKWSSMQCDNQREMHYSFAESRYKAMLKAAPIHGGDVEGK